MSFSRVKKKKVLDTLGKFAQTGPFNQETERNPWVSKFKLPRKGQAQIKMP